MNANQQGQKISAEDFLTQTAFDTELSNLAVYRLCNANGWDETQKELGVPSASLKILCAKVCTALRIINRRQNPNPQGQKELSRGIPNSNWTNRTILAKYRECKHSLRETQKETNLSFPELRKAIQAASKAENSVCIKWKDWNAGRKKRERFDLFDWIKKAHKHFSLRVFCETINWSPKAVLDLCAQCNAAGYPVTAPKITGEQLAWLQSYMEGETDYENAKKRKPVQARRGGKEIFKRLLHQENPNRRMTNLPSKSRKKRNSPGAKRGRVASRGGRVKSAPNLWGKGQHKISASERQSIMAYLNS